MTIYRASSINVTALSPAACVYAVTADGVYWLSVAPEGCVIMGAVGLPGVQGLVASLQSEGTDGQIIEGSPMTFTIPDFGDIASEPVSRIIIIAE